MKPAYINFSRILMNREMLAALSFLAKLKVKPTENGFTHSTQFPPDKELIYLRLRVNKLFEFLDINPAWLKVTTTPDDKLVITCTDTEKGWNRVESAIHQFRILKKTHQKTKESLRQNNRPDVLQISFPCRYETPKDDLDFVRDVFVYQGMQPIIRHHQSIIYVDLQGQEINNAHRNLSFSLNEATRKR